MHVNARRVIVRFNIRRALSTLVITLVDSARDTRKNSRKDAKRIFESFSRVDHPVRLETIEARRGNWGGIYKKKKIMKTKESRNGTELKESAETIREEKIGERSSRREEGRRVTSMKLQAVCYIQQVRIFSLLANVTN